MSDQKHAVLAYIVRDGNVLSAWNKTYHCWGLVGGKVEPGETFAEALRRELREESGLEAARVWYPEIDISPTYSGSGRLCHTFSVSIGNAEPRLVEVSTGLAWMTRDFLEHEPKTGAWFRRFFSLPYFEEHK